MKKVAAAATAALAGISVVSAVKSIGEIGMAYQDTLNNLQAVSGATAAQMAKVSATAKQLGSDTSLTATSAADAAVAMTELSKGGLSVDSAMQAAKGTLQLAAAAGIDAAQAATIQSAALNAYALDATQAGHVSDVLANAANAAAGEITDFSDGLQQSGAVAHALGISLEDTSAVLGILANNGIKGSDAGTLLKSALLALESPSKQAKAAMNDLGLTAFDAKGNFVGLDSIFGQLQKSSKSMTAEQYAAATSTLFGSDAARLAGVAAKEGSAGFETMAAAMNKSGSAADVAAAKSKGVHGAIEALKSSIETVQINLFEAVAPAVEKTLRRVGDAFTNLTTQVPTLWAAFTSADAQGVGAALDNIFGNTGKYVGTFRDLAQAVLDFWAGLTLQDAKDVGAPLEGLVSVGYDLKTAFKDLLSIAQQIAPVIGTILGGQVKIAWEAFKLLLPIVTDFLNFMANNQAALWGFVGVMTALVAVTKAHEAAMAVSSAGGLLQWINQTKIVTAVTKTWTAVQWALDAAMDANPIVLIGLAIAALVAGIIIAYKNSETFRDIVQGALKAVGDAVGWLWGIVKTYFTFIIDFWTAVGTGIWTIWSTVIKVAWDAISTAAQWLWDTVLKPVFSAISDAWSALATGLKWAWDNIISPVWDVIQVIAKILFAVLVVATFGPILLAWEAMTAGIKWAWDNVLKPAWDAISAAANWLWNTVLQPVFTYIGQLWDTLLRDIDWAWNNVLKPAWDAVAAAANWLWNNVLKPVFTYIGELWDTLLRDIDWAWNNILKPAWNAIQAAANWLYNNVLKPIFDALGAAWDAVLKGMVWVWDHILHPMFDAFGTAAGALRDGFNTVVDAIGTAWNKIKEYASVPINFVIGTVLNKGLFAAFNWVIDKLGLPKEWHLNDLPLIHLATGGRVPGYSPNDKADNIPAMLTAGEYVQPVKTVDYYGHGVMNAIRNRQIPKDALQGALHLAGGGPVYQQLFDRVKQQFPDARMNDGFRPGAADLHGAGKAVDLGWSKAPGGNGNAYLASMNQWLYDNFKGSILELIYDGAGDNRPDIKNGADHNYGAALAAQHHNHVHLASNGLGAGLGIAAGGGGGGGLLGGLWDSVTGVFNHLKDSIAKPLSDMFSGSGHNLLTDTIGSTVEQLPGKLWEKAKNVVGDMASKLWNGATDLASSGWNAVSGAASSAWNFLTGSGNDTKSIVQSIAGQKNWGSGAEWSALDWIIGKESGWNPKAKNPSSTASGLGQFVNGTWMGLRGSSTATRMMDASIQDQGAAIMRYIGQRYGDPLMAKAFWQSHNWYSEGGPVTGYAGGTALASPGLHLVGEKGPELLSFRGGERVLTADRTRSALATESPMVGELHIHVGDGATVKEGIEETMFQLRRIKRGGGVR